MSSPPQYAPSLHEVCSTMGRSALAPTLRAGTGTTKGELLHTWADMEDANLGSQMDWDGWSYPAALSDDGTTTIRVPDAYPTLHNVLPHHHPSIHQNFPRAVACESEKDLDPEEDLELEKVGLRIGLVNAADGQ